jgi:hypothetical protein
MYALSIIIGCAKWESEYFSPCSKQKLEEWHGKIVCAITLHMV